MDVRALGSSNIGFGRHRIKTLFMRCAYAAPKRPRPSPIKVSPSPWSSQVLQGLEPACLETGVAWRCVHEAIIHTKTSVALAQSLLVREDS
jgi:hypothetical protein